MEWMDRPGTTLTFTHGKNVKIKFINKCLNWERVGDKTIEEGTTFQQLTHAVCVKSHTCLIRPT